MDIPEQQLARWIDDTYRRLAPVVGLAFGIIMMVGYSTARRLDIDWLTSLQDWILGFAIGSLGKGFYLLGRNQAVASLVARIQAEDSSG